MSQSKCNKDNWNIRKMLHAFTEFFTECINYLKNAEKIKLLI